MPSLNFLSSSPPTEALRIESEPPGAEAKTSLGQTCRTPCELAVQAAREQTVTLALAGYQSQTVTVRPGTASGEEQDAAAGPPRLAPNPVYVEFAPVPKAGPPKKASPKKKLKPATAAAKPAPSPTPPAATAAAEPPPIASSSATEPAASATQYPWPSR
jgi:hypothetical protein